MCSSSRPDDDPSLKSTSIALPVSIRIRLPASLSASPPVILKLCEDSSIDQLYEAVASECHLSAGSFVLTIPYPFPGQPLERSSTVSLGDMELTGRVTVTVCLSSTGTGRPSSALPASMANVWTAQAQGGFVHSSYVESPRFKGDSYESLCICSLNVWFEPHYFELRCRAQLDMFKKLDCDILCLQEVTQPLLDILFSDSWIQKNFWVSHHKRESYGVVILSRLIPRVASEVMLRSGMGRTLVIADLGSLAVATVHLESLNNSSLRCEQLCMIDEALSDCDNVTLCGDFNFDADDPKVIERASLGKAYVDPMPAKVPTLGVNYDSKKYPPKRFDRLLIKGQLWSAQEARTFGETRLHVPPNTPQPASSYIKSRGAFLSDHLGLVVRIVRKVM